MTQSDLGVPDAYAPSGAGEAPSFLTEWLKARRLEADSQSISQGLEAIDIDSLLPEDTSIRGISEYLREYVKGQDEQVRSIAVLLSMHLEWCRKPNPVHTPPKALVLGPTGSGKTFTFRTAAQLLRLPFVSVDSTSLVPAGIVGQQVEDIAANLVNLADEILRESGVPRRRDDDIRLAERGLVVLDEFDKLATKDLDGRGVEDAGLRSGVQRRILKLVEGAPINVGMRLHGESSLTGSRTLDSRGLLIIGAGAFQGIEKLRSRRPQAISRRPADRDKILSVDIQEFGFVPELVARLPVLIQFAELSESDLLEILEDPNISPATVWSNYTSSLGIELQIPRESLRVFASRAAELSLGARGLQQVIFPVLSRIVSEELSRDSTPRMISVAPERISQ